MPSARRGALVVADLGGVAVAGEEVGGPRPRAGPPRWRGAPARWDRRSARPRTGRRGTGAPSSRPGARGRAARWVSRWASKVLPDAGDVEAEVEALRGRDGGHLVAASHCACSRVVPYLRARWSTRSPSRSRGAAGSSSKLRQVTFTSSDARSRRARPRSGACRRSTTGRRCRTRISTLSGTYTTLASRRTPSSFHPELAQRVALEVPVLRARPAGASQSVA